MAKHGEQSRGEVGPSDASRREAGPAPDFALVRPYVGSLGDEPTGEQPIGEHLIPTHRRYGRRSKVSVDPPDATAEIIYPRMSGFGRALPSTTMGSRRGHRHVPLIVAAGVVFVVAMIGAYMLRPTSGTPTSESFVPIQASLPAFTPTPSASPQPVVSSAPPTQSHTHKPRPSQPPSPAASTPGGAAFGPKSGPTPPPSASVPPPATGAIKGIAGMCVDDSGRATQNGNPIQLYDCNGTPAQIWTTQANGTVQVLGKCMQVSAQSAGSRVVLWDCDGSASEVWRAGAHDSLVNVASGLCLDSPRWMRSGTQLEIARCDGGISQRWNLP